METEPLALRRRRPRVGARDRPETSGEEDPIPSGQAWRLRRDRDLAARRNSRYGEDP